MGCFGCHTIPGFENAKPIGTALNDWGIKLPARLDFGHIKEYLTDQEQAADVDGNRDGTDLFYQEKVMHESRMGFLYQKLHRPAQLRLSEEEREVQDVGRPPPDAAVRLGQRSGRRRRGDDVRAGADQREDPRQVSPQDAHHPGADRGGPGRRDLNRFNCAGCHVLEMPKFTVPAGVKVAEAFTNFKANLRSSYNGTSQRLSGRALSDTHV